MDCLSGRLDYCLKARSKTRNRRTGTRVSVGFVAVGSVLSCEIMRFNEAVVLLSFASIYQVADCAHLELATINIVEDLPLDSNGRLADNWLIVLDTPECKKIFSEAWLRANPSFRNIAAYSKNLSKTFKGSESTCNAVALTAGTKSNLIPHPLEKNKIELSVTGEEDIVKWIHGKNILSV